jgi:hypothetical protein
METKNFLNVCGSVTKSESLLWLKNNIMEHTYVAEANMPYASYYGRVPETPEPNSLFLFTERYYTLEESLRFTQNIDLCSKNKVNVASAVVCIHNKRYPAIRLRNFPDYEHLKMLQKCFLELGLKFARKVPHANEALVTVNKCFVLEMPEEGIYLDKTERNEGYIAIPKSLDQDDFNSLLKNVWNNSECEFFDAAQGGLIINGSVTDIIRVYTEHLKINLLKCIRKEVLKQLKNY